MYGLEVYKKLFEFLEKNEIIQDDMYSFIQNDIEGKIVFEHDGKQFVLNEMWDDTIHRFDSDKPWYHYLKLDHSDDYCIFTEGYYDSWGGGEYGSEFNIGETYQIIKTYTGFKPVKI